MPRTERPHMPDYGVTEGRDGLLPWSWAEAKLVGTRNYWLVTASADGRPHALPVWGQWLTEPDRFVFSCAAGARKARNIAANARVVVTSEDTVECVSVEGTARPLHGDAQVAAAQGFGPKYETDPQKAADLVEFYATHTMFEVMPEVAFGIVEREEEFARRATRWVW